MDRDNLGRERENLFEELWADPATRIMPIFQGSALLSSPTSLALLPADAVPDGELKVYLGRSLSTTSPEPVGTRIVAVQLDDAGHLAEAEWGNIRTLGNVLSDRDAGMLVEAWWRRPDVPGPLAWSMLAVVIACQAGRWWCIGVLGRHWNTRVIVVPGTPPVLRGPYRVMAHPNYLVVVVEGMALPLIHAAWMSAVVFTVLNAALLTVRLRVETAALRSLPDSRQQVA